MLLSAMQRPALAGVPGASGAGAAQGWCSLVVEVHAPQAEPVPCSQWGSAFSIGLEPPAPASGLGAAPAPAGPRAGGACEAGGVRRLALSLPVVGGAAGGLSEGGALLAWHPEGDCLAVAVASAGDDTCWLLLLDPELRLLHECCWHAAVGKPPKGACRRGLLYEWRVACV
jgi:hypothetical protein